LQWQARQARAQYRPDLVLLDIWMPDTDGVTLLKEWASTGQLTMPVIMMSGHATVETAAEATRIGALDFLEKPITMQKLLKAVEKGLSKPVTRAADAALATAMVSAAVPSLNGLTIEQAMTGGHMVAQPRVDLGPQAQQAFNLEGPLREVRDGFEKAYFEYHLVKEQGSMTRVAEKTGLERTHLYRKLKQLGVDLSRSKRPTSR
jgi:DNA-binding NtrC family response regulator